MKKYNSPKIEIIEIKTQDVVTTSGLGFIKLFSADIESDGRVQRLDSYSTSGLQ